MLKLDELFDVFLRIARLEGFETLLLQVVVDGRVITRAKHIGGCNNRRYSIRDGAQSVVDSFCGLWIPWIASNPD
jgi:hypothetical protein